MKIRRNIINPDPQWIDAIRGGLSCHPAVARLLANRGISTSEGALAFLNPSLSHIRPPFSIRQMDVAVERIHRALVLGEKILIFGDYDVDGVTATALILEFLRCAGADVIYYIPHRTGEGYGLQACHITDVALPAGVRLIVTVDCGSSSHEAVAAAKGAGIDVVITDHHSLPESLPQALAVVNPKRADCPSGLDHLAGVGVAFYLAIWLRKHLRDTGFWQGRTEPNLRNFCDLVALGTVADMVPMIGENRILTRIGLEVIQSGCRPGLAALMETSRIQQGPLDSEALAFRLAPRLNAAGRMEHAKTAVELFTATDPDEAAQMARYLDGLNARRQETEKEMLSQILDLLTREPERLSCRSLVLHGENWHEGLLGIVASRLVERYYRPVVLISVAGGRAKGSARSIPGFHLFEGLSRCAGSLEGFGGHTMAAGLRINPDNLDRFRDQFEETVRQMTAPEDFIPALSIDCELVFDDITPELVDGIESLMPFGAGNPEPLFAACGVQVQTASIVGKNHRRMVLGQAGSKNGRSFQAIHFRIDPEKPQQPSMEQLIFRLRWNRWNGKKSVQILVEET